MKLPELADVHAFLDGANEATDDALRALYLAHARTYLARLEEAAGRARARLEELEGQALSAGEVTP